MRKYLPLVLVPLLFIGCKKSNDQAKIDDQIIQSYISSHHLNAVAEPNGLYYVETTAGSGGSPNANSTVTVAYKGYFTDGTVFDANLTGSFSTPLYETIPGWIEGIPLMKKGGRATLLIPSALGYGSTGSGAVPPNTVLIFDVYLINYQ